MTSLVLSLTTRDDWSAPVAKAMKNVVVNAKNVEVAFDGIDRSVKRVQSSVEGLSKAIQQLVVDQKKIGSGLFLTSSEPAKGPAKMDGKLFPKLPEVPGSSGLSKLATRFNVVVGALNTIHDLAEPAARREENRDMLRRGVERNLFPTSSAEERKRNLTKIDALSSNSTKEYGDLKNNAGLVVLHELTQKQAITGDKLLGELAKFILKSSEIYKVPERDLAQITREIKEEFKFDESQMSAVMSRLFQDVRAAGLVPGTPNVDLRPFVENIQKEYLSGGKLVENVKGKAVMRSDEASYRESPAYANRQFDRGMVRLSDGLHLGDLLVAPKSIFTAERYPKGNQPIPPVKWPVFSFKPKQLSVDDSENKKSERLRPAPPVKWPVFPNEQKRPSVQGFPVLPLSIFPLRTLEYPKEYQRVNGTSSVPNFVKRNQPTDAVLIQSKRNAAGDKSNDKVNATLTKASGSIDKCAGTFQQAAIAMSKPVQVHCTVDVKGGNIVAQMRQADQQAIRRV